MTAKNTITTIRFAAEQERRAMAAARLEGISFSQFVRRALRVYLGVNKK